VGHEDADADHAQECCNYLDHHDGPLRPADTKRHGRPNSQKKSLRRNRFTERLMILGNRERRRGRILAWIVVTVQLILGVAMAVHSTGL
jgi:hypothetical protein